MSSCHSEVKVDLKQKADFYVQSVTSLMHGEEVSLRAGNKQGSQTLFDRVMVSGVGAAIAQAVVVARSCEAAGIASVAKITTSCLESMKGHRFGRIDIHLERMDVRIELCVIDIGGAPIGKITASRSWQLSDLKMAVAGLVGLSVDEVDAVYGDSPLRSARPLACIAPGEPAAQITMVRFEAPAFEGLWACYPCSILGLFPGGTVEYFWHDDYWDSPLRETLQEHLLSQGFSPVCPSLAARGKWKSCRGTNGTWQIAGRVVWQPFNEMLDFQVQVLRDNESGRRHGVSEWILDATFMKADGSQHEKKTLFMMPTPPGGYDPRKGEERKMWPREFVFFDESDDPFQDDAFL